MAYIGMFTEEAIQKTIDRVADRVGPQGFALIAHLDSDGEASISVVKKIGTHVSVEAAGIMDISEGFKFDKKHLKAKAEVIASW